MCVCTLNNATQTHSRSIETANLDGETNLKIKQGVPQLYNLPTGPAEGGLDFLKHFRGVVQSDEPNDKVRLFD